MSDLIARLRIEADASDTPAVANRVERALDGVRASAQRTGTAMAGTEVGANRLAGGLDRAGDQAQRFEARTRGAASGTALLTSALGGAGLALFVNDAQKAAFAAEGLELGLGAVTGGSVQAKAELGFVRQEAARLGLVAQTTAKDFLDLAAATNGSGIAGESTRQIWLATAEAGMVLGRSPEQIGRGLTALSQIAGKGVVSMEEIRQQLAEAIPGSAAIGARALNMTTAEFNKLVESGTLTAEVFLPAFAAQLREEFGPSIDAYLLTPLGQSRQAIGAFQTSLNDLRADAGEGFLEGMTDGLERLNGTLADGETATLARDLGEAVGQGAAMAAEALVFVIDNVETLTLAVQVLAAVGIARFLTSSALAAQQAAAAYVAKGVAVRAASANAAAGLASESAAAAGLTAAIRGAALAEVQKSQATLVAANAARASALAHYAQAEAAVAAGASAAVLAQRQAIAAASLVALRTASQQAAVAQVELAAAQTYAATATSRVGTAAIAARSGMAALMSMVGGPWVAAFLAAGGAVWLITDAIADAREAAATAEANTRAYGDAMADAGEYLRIAADEASAFGGENSGAVGGTDALSAATNRLAAETWALADARAEATRQGLLGARQKLLDERAELTNPGIVKQAAGTVLSGIAMATGNPGYRSAANIVQPDNSARIAKIDQETGSLLGMAMEISLSSEGASRPAVPGAASGGTKGGGSGGGGRDRSADMARDLALDAQAIQAHTAALMLGEAALDAWRVAQAGADAVAQSGLADGSAVAEGLRAQAEEGERLAIANERIEQASGFARSAMADVAALERRATAALLGRDALEALRVSEAGLAQLTAARITSLDQLSGPEREAVANAVAVAEAKERQAIATEQAEAAGQSIEALNEQIAAEGRRQAAIGRGIEAEVAYARAEFVRQEVERAGLKITDEAAQAIIDKADALFTLRALTDGSQAAADAERELRLMRLSNRERELAVRAETILKDLAVLRLGLTEAELKVVADKRARSELEAEETAAAIGRITGSLRDGFIKDGSLGIDELADYAEERFRAAVYDALLAEPLRIVVEATVDIVNDLAKQVFGGDAASGFLADLFGAAGGFGAVMGNAGIGGAVGSSLGLGSGNGLLDTGLSVGGSFLGGIAGTALTGAAANGILSGALGSLAAGLGPILGPLGALAGLAIGSLLKDEKRPYTRADIVAQGGAFRVAGTQGADGGAKSVADQLGKAITESLNAASKLFGIDVTRLEGLYTTAGFVSGGNYKALGGEGFFGGDIKGLIDYFNQAGTDLKGNTLGAGVSFDQVGSADELAEQVVRETILRAIAAGASDLTDAEQALVIASSSLEEAIALIGTARGFTAGIDDMLMELLDPAGFEKKKALDAVEATYQALKAEADKLIGAGLLSADALAKIERLRDLQLDAALNGTAGVGTNPFAEASGRLQAWLDGLAVSEAAPGGRVEQRDLAEAQYRRVLAQAEAGDADALNDLATYADRLLRADRSATSSAPERRALYEAVTGDVERLLARAAVATEPLNAAAISGPIVDALAGSQTALADILLSLPSDTAAPLLEGILRQPDWATRLLGENVQVPPALLELRDRVVAVAPDVAGPIVQAVLTTPAWVAAMDTHIMGVVPSIDLVRAALEGLPPAVAGPIIGALTQTPGWGQSAVDYLRTLPPSLDLLQAVTEGMAPRIALPIVEAVLRDPAWAGPVLEELRQLNGPLPDVAGPIIAALAQTPEWGRQAVEYLKSLPPSLDLLSAMFQGQPAAISQPIIDALIADPAWAAGLLDQLRQLNGPPPDIAGPIVAALAATPEWGSQAVDYLRSLPPSIEMLARIFEGQPAAVTGPIVDALAADPAWAGRMLELLTGMAGNPDWAARLQAAIGEDLTLSIDSLGAVLDRLLALLGATAGKPSDLDPQINPGPGDDWGKPSPPPVVPFPPVMPPPVLRPPVVDGGFGFGGGGSGGGFDGEVPILSDLNRRLTLSPETTMRVVEDQTRSLGVAMQGLLDVIDQRMAELAQATSLGFEDMAGVSAEQASALRDVASAQRATNAHMIAKAG